jgi:hypothetical protein
MNSENLLHVLDALGSNLGPETDYCEVIHGFLQSMEANASPLK